MTLEAHPYADRFPLLCDAELVELVESIKANGLRNPIVLDTDGRILDGRNRARACEIAGVEPEYVTYEGDDLAEYVIDTNASRRHMTTGARAMATALVLADDGRRVNGRCAAAHEFQQLAGAVTHRMRTSGAQKTSELFATKAAS